ncbi:hypothetical protein HELRODRAFT_152335, partial [Helobdella robusta]|uniref:Uncharacterized protein n=1 Tax=Helobdella robusta TaxID=6412 RepID=T1EKR0_HELRO
RFNKFLLHNLPPSKQQAILAFEPCVVSSVKYKKQFKFIVIERDGVCLTESIPNTYKKVIDFADVLDVTLESDQPDFLKGKDHDDCQHISIIY